MPSIGGANRGCKPLRLVILLFLCAVPAAVQYSRYTNVQTRCQTDEPHNIVYKLTGNAKHPGIYRYSKKEHIHLVNLPASGYAFRDDQPVGWVEASFTKEKGEFVLHAVAGNSEKDGQRVVLRWD